MPNTPNRGLPYPANTEPLANAAAAIQALASALDDPRKAVSVARAAAQSIPDSTVTNITFDTELYDTDTMYPGGSSPTITVRTAGLWLVTAAVGFSTGTSGRRFATIKLNAAEIHRTEGASTANAALVQATWTGRLAVNDVLNLAAFQVSGGALTTSATASQTPRLQASWLGP